ncbi:uncharacterized protein LOC127751104 [Frankliniella occidentalis]|uniref:Uncharacterized protein LOC127751104 n=1 Tax=Frankliniella occidentalis TaxID=133901 RepID=A0A9C6X6U9_FRAOC|nr:uncharacterized protein LOC127751104 [Frankliniella occidentalis]
MSILLDLYSCGDRDRKNATEAVLEDARRRFKKEILLKTKEVHLIAFELIDNALKEYEFVDLDETFDEPAELAAAAALDRPLERISGDTSKPVMDHHLDEQHLALKDPAQFKVNFIS